LHGHGREAERSALAVALGLVLAFAAVEVAGGLIAGSLALLADAVHMAADAGSLGLALGAAWLARRPPTLGRSFGFARAEILAALTNGAALVALAVWIFVEAARRLSNPPDIRAGWVLGVGVGGLAVNLVAARVLRRPGGGSLNIRAALLHVLADLLGSLGVVVAALVVLAAGWERADPLVSILIGVLVLASAWGVLRESAGILLESAPEGLDVGEVGHAMAAHPGVVGVHDLHVWTITSGFPSLSAHVVVERDADCHAVRRELEQVLHDRFALDHTTLQVEHEQGLLVLGKTGSDQKV
jgi:cobalt-zinc-cadmium efflux system protein